MKQTIFISFSLGNTSLSDYFLSLVGKLSKKYRVVIFSDVRINEMSSIPENVIIKYWPSKRPTKFVDGVFLYKNIKEYKPIMTISVFGSVNIFLLVGFLCGVKIRIAWIRTLSSQFVQKKILVFRKILFYKLATNIITNSEATKVDAVENFHVAASKIIVLPNSVRDLYSEILIEAKDSRLITYVGRLHKSKGVEVLINAFFKIHLKFPDFKLMIVGSGKEEVNLKKQVENLKIEKSVYFKENVSKSRVLEMFKTSYLAVVPSISEAFGYTVIEAMSMKTLIIGANNTGIKEIIKDDQTGFLFETNNADDLQNKISDAIMNPEKRNKLAAGGYSHFKNNYETSIATIRDLSYFDNLILNLNE